MCDMHAMWADDLESMAASIEDVIELHETLHIGTVTTADNRHGAAVCEIANGLPHIRGQQGMVRPIDNRGERTVIVEKDDYALVLHALSEVIGTFQR